MIEQDTLQIVLQRMMCIQNEFIDALYLGKDIEKCEELYEKNITLLNKAIKLYKDTNDIYTQE